MSTAAEALYVPEATYLEREIARGPEDHRSEYVDGVIVAMTGSDDSHTEESPCLIAEVLSHRRNGSTGERSASPTSSSNR